MFTTLTIVKKLGSTDRPAFYNDPEAVKRAREQWVKDQTGPFTVFQCAHGIGFMKIDRVLQSKEFDELDEEVKSHLLEETIPSYEMITVSDAAHIHSRRFRVHGLPRESLRSKADLCISTSFLRLKYHRHKTQSVSVLHL